MKIEGRRTSKLHLAACWAYVEMDQSRGSIVSHFSCGSDMVTCGQPGDDGKRKECAQSRGKSNCHEDMRGVVDAGGP